MIIECDACGNLFSGKGKFCSDACRGAASYEKHMEKELEKAEKLAFSQCPPFGVAMPCKIIEVYDGDTLVIESVGGGRLRVRLLDCWAPELKDPGGIAARDFCRLAVEQSIETAIWIPFKANIAAMLTFGRVLAHIYCNGHNLTELIVAAGHGSLTKPDKSKE